MPKADEFFGFGRLLERHGNLAILLFWVFILICITVVAVYLD